MNQVIEIGTKFIRKGYKHPKEEEVIDIHTTRNAIGEIVKWFLLISLFLSL